MKKVGLIKLIGIIAIGIACIGRFGGIFKTETVKIDISSLLEDVIDIAELNTSEFKYRGIADIYTNESRNKIQCRVCYNAVVKAGVNMHKIEIDVDQDNKVCIVTLPEIDLEVNIDDEQPMALLPSNAKVELDIMRKYSKEDAENEARNSSELISSAQDNLKATIEGLLSPILKDEGYSLAWN